MRLLPNDIPSRIRHDDRGMTLVEVMVGVMAATVVMFAGYAAMTVANSMQVRTTDRIDATARGRVAVDRITRMIRSQQCLDSNTPAMQWAGDNGMQFYASVAEATDQQQPVERRRIMWTKTGKLNGNDIGDIVETTWRSTTSLPPYSFRSTPSRVSTLAEDVEPDGGVIFKYFKYDSGSVGRPSATPAATNVSWPVSDFNPTGRGASSADLPRIVVVEMRFLSRPRSDRSLKAFTVPFFNRVAVRTADPSDPTRSPLCL